MPFCSKCGEEVLPNAEFCSSCGFSLKGQTPETPAPMASRAVPPTSVTIRKKTHKKRNVIVIVLIILAIWIGLVSGAIFYPVEYLETPNVPPYVSVVAPGYSGFAYPLGPGIVLDPTNGMIYADIAATNSTAIIDTTTERVVGSVHSFSAFAVDPSRNLVYGFQPGFSGISVLDGSTNSVISTLQCSGCEGTPAVDPVTDMLYSPTGGMTVLVVNIKDGAVVANIPGLTFPTRAVVNPVTDMVYVSSFVGYVSSSVGTLVNVTVINGRTNTVVTNVGVGNAPLGMAVDPSKDLVYGANEKSDTISVLNGATNTVSATIQVGPDVVPNCSIN